MVVLFINLVKDIYLYSKCYSIQQYSINNSVSISTIRRKIKSGKFDYPEASWGKISEDAKYIVNHLLVVDPKERMTLDELLKHPWILGVKTEKKQGNVLEKMREWNSKRKII